MAKLSEMFALRRGIQPSAARKIMITAALHDVGKQKIDKNIINKPGKLDAQEFEVMKTHTKLGAEMLSSVQGELGEMAQATALFHHEWYDGNGYWGRRSGDLPVYVPMVAIVDMFTALICKRAYKDAWPPNDALEYIKNQAGIQFCPELANDFVSLIRSDGSIPALFGGKKI